MSAVHDFQEFFNYAIGSADDIGVAVASVDPSAGAATLKRMLTSTDAWPLSKMNDLVAGRPASGLRDPHDESSRDFHIAVEVIRWAHNREIEIAPNRFATLATDAIESEQGLVQIAVDLIAYCRAKRGDPKDKAGRVDYLNRTAAKALSCARQNISRADSGAVPLHDDSESDDRFVAEESSSKTPVRAWPFFFGGDADGSAEHDYVVEDLIHEASVAMIYGRQGSLKTQLVFDLAAHVGRGELFQGLRTKQGITIYVAAEGAGAIGKRVAGAYLEHPWLPRDAIVCIPQAVNLVKEGETEAFANFLVETILPALSMPVRMIVYDTLSKSTPGYSDSDDETIGLVESSARFIAGRIARVSDTGFVPACLVIHHPRKNDETYRGSGSIEGNLDTLINIKKTDAERLEDRLFEVELDKVKDGPTDRSWAYRAALVHVGTTPSGKLNYAPVVRFITDEDRIAAVTEVRVGGRKMTPNQKHMIELMARIETRDGKQWVPPNVLEESGYLAKTAMADGHSDCRISGFPIETLRRMFEACEGDSDESTDGRGTVSDASRKRWERRRDSIVKAGIAWAFQDWIWLDNEGIRTGVDGERVRVDGKTPPDGGPDGRGRFSKRPVPSVRPRAECD